MSAGSHEVCRELGRVRERGQVPAWHDVEVESQPVARHATLEVDREEAVVGAGDDAGRDVGPGLDGAGGLEGTLGLGTLVLLATRRDRRVDVVEEVRVEVEL